MAKTVDALVYLPPFVCYTLGMPNRIKYTRDVLMAAVAQSYSVAEVCRRLGVSDKGSMNTLMRRRIEDAGLDTTHFTGRGSNRGPKHCGGSEKLKSSEILIRSRLGPRKELASRLRAALDDEGVPRVCALCRQGETWRGEPLRLHIDHLNGDPLDNRKKNLRYLCPNCHSQTGNFGVKNLRLGGGMGDAVGSKPAVLET